MAKNGVKFPGLVLRVWFEEPDRSEGFCHVRACVRLANGYSLYHHEKDAGGKYCGVQVKSQSSYEHLARSPGGFDLMYGAELIWDSGRAPSLSECRNGVAALADLEAKLDRVAEQHGPPASFGAYIQRIANAIGVGGISMPNKESARDPRQGAYEVDHKIQEWRELARERTGTTAS